MERSSILSIFLLICSSIFAHFYGIIDLDYFSTKEYKIFRSLHGLSNRKVSYQSALLGFDFNHLLSLNSLKNNITLGDPYLSSSISDVQLGILEELHKKFRFHFERDTLGLLLVNDSEVFSELTKLIKSKQPKTISDGVVPAFLEEFKDLAKVQIGASVSKKTDVKERSVIGACHSQETTKLGLEWKPGDDLFAIHRSELPRRGNRVLIFSNTSVPNVLCWEDFFASAKTSTYDLVVIGGLHSLQYLPEKEYVRYLSILADYLKSLDASRPVHLELGNVDSVDFLQHMADVVFPLVHSIGIGENSVLVLNKAVVENDSNVKLDAGIAIAGGVAIINDILHGVISKVTEGAPQSRLSRMFFHSSSFLVTAVKESHWSNNEAALASASLAVSKSACNVKSSLDLVDKRLAMPVYFTLSKADSSFVAGLNMNKPVVTWSYKDTSFYIAPVIICDDPDRTKDHGLTASAVALVRSKFYVTEGKRGYVSQNEAEDSDSDL